MVILQLDYVIETTWVDPLSADHPPLVPILQQEDGGNGGVQISDFGSDFRWRSQIDLFVPTVASASAPSLW
jgi:hypothetical protein